jgi:hypothetical protein
MVEVSRMKGTWELETWRGKGYTLVPVERSGPVPLSPEAEEDLRSRYLGWFKNHKAEVTLGALVIVGGVAFMLATNPAGWLILIPIAVAAS